MLYKKIIAAALLSSTVFCGAASAVTLSHDYQLNGNLNDALGGPALQSLGGTLTSTGRYDFAANQGLRLEGALSNIAVWSLDFRASYASLSGHWKKLVDFRDRATDDGLYFAADKLQFYPDATGTSSVTTDTDYTIALSRDAAGTLRGYVNGLLQWSILNETESHVIGNVLTFFADDYATGQGEAQAGSVDFIRIYDGVLSADEVSVLNGGGSVGAVPEPATALLAVLGLAGLGLGRRAARQ